MKGRNLTGVAAAALGVILATALAFTQSPPRVSQPAIEGPVSAKRQPGSCRDRFPTLPDEPSSTKRAMSPYRLATADPGAARALSHRPCPPCSRSPLCGRRGGFPRGQLQRVQWKQTMGYTFTYPYVLPPGFGGVPSVALDSKGNLWVFQRAEEGKPQLFKFDPNYKIILQVGPDVIGYQEKAHGMAVDLGGQRLDHSRRQLDRPRRSVPRASCC